jgi:hypothetical protein
MKALSITRPWAELILRGKNVENRTWTTKFRGQFLVHAAKSWSGVEAYAVAETAGLALQRDFLDGTPSGGDQSTGIVGIAELVDVCSVEMAEGHITDGSWPCWCGPWAMSAQHHWKLANVRRLPRPVPCRGALGLWMPPADVIAAVEAQLAEVSR